MRSTLTTAVTGLRERQKQDRERRIITAARRLFDRKGYVAAGMGEVAARAGLAVGTIYNYFPSKDDLLVAIMKREAERVTAVGNRIVEAPYEDPSQALCALADLFVNSITADGRLLWREVLASAVTQPHKVGARLFELDMRLMAEFATLIERLKSRCQLAAEIDSFRAAGLVYSVCLTWGMAFLMNEQMDWRTMRDEIHRGISLAVRGLLPRSSDHIADPKQGG